MKILYTIRNALIHMSKNVTLWNIEPGVRDLVKVVNEIPFIDTDQSCEGHVQKMGSAFRVDPPDLMFYVKGVAGWNHRVKKFEHLLTRDYLRIMKRMTEKHPFASLRIIDYNAGNPMPHYDFAVGEVGYYPEAEARGKLHEYREVIKELTERTGRFVAKHFR